MEPSIIVTVHSLIGWAEERMPEFERLLEQMVELESPSGDSASIDRFGEFLAGTVSGDAEVSFADGGEWGRHVLCLWGTVGPDAPQLLILAHSDTVWPLGTLQSMPFRKGDGRLWGPGVLDIKGGMALVLFALRALRESGAELKGKVLLQVNSDEEVGSPSSRALTEANALASHAVLVVEPGTGLTGKLKTERKGVGDFRLEVKGLASHAGVDFSQGASAVLELARQLDRIAGWTDLKQGITVNPGVIGGGTRTNVVAAEAWAEIDIRVRKLADAAMLERRFAQLEPFDSRCSLTVSGGLNRPPMERSAGGDYLFQLATDAGAQLGIAVEESFTGGGSDGNFTAALGIPTLDGLGCVGEGAHAPNESILLKYVPERIALLALLIGKLCDPVLTKHFPDAPKSRSHQ